MRSHIEVGRRYPEITINTTYSFGLDDQEFVVAFEGDDPGDVPRPRPGAAPDRVERLHRARDADLHLRRDVGRARRSTRSTAAPAAPRRTDRDRLRPAGRRIPYPSPFAHERHGQATEENPLRVAIIGAGPSGFYAAEHILKDEATHAQVDLFDRLPTPFGLVRGGVAPDHPKIKSVIRVYEKTAARDGFRFFGNVKVGARHRGRRARAPLPRDRLHGRLRDRPPARDPRRGPARQPRRHRLRRLVQRPPRLRRRGVRPLAASARS